MGLLAAGALLSACTRAYEPSTDGDLLTPRFEPDVGTAPGADGSTPTIVAPGVTAAPGTGGFVSTSTTMAARAGGPAAPAVTSTIAQVAVTDPVGDLSPSPADAPPQWADLVGAVLVRRADGFELRVRVAGGSAPSGTDEDHTMNIASFYDVDGNGTVDYEVWANLAARGWGGSWFDNRGRRGGFTDQSGVTVAVSGDEVVLRFPLSHLGNADRFRWSVASEWGRYEVLGTVAARDDMPDDDGAVRFPA